MFTIIRAGDFFAVPTGDNHCGLSSQPHRFLYRVALSCHSTDEKGFVFDQFAIQSYFDSLENIPVSCENLAHEAAIYFLRNLPACRAISVHISPTRFDEAEAAFQLEEARLGEYRAENSHLFTTDDLTEVLRASKESVTARPRYFSKIRASHAGDM